ncbi:glutamine amidotransferase-related protein [Micromonospora sp. SL4-19]|uniref:glutamine amidotransferase-related protein n=1 Tax=Micromonospora sp. SL4-19 TaxID=3399129 RepID=UPI003A4DFE93
MSPRSTPPPAPFPAAADARELFQGRRRSGRGRAGRERSWRDRTTWTMMPRMSLVTRLALVGDRHLDNAGHAPVVRAIASLTVTGGLTIDATWIPTAQAHGGLDDYDGVWLVGSPYETEAGVIAAAGAARRGGIPLLGTCGGLQLAVIEFAMQVAGLTEEDVLVPLSCSVGGNECRVRATSGSLFERALGASRTVERYHCSYGLNPETMRVLTGHGMRFTGFDDDGLTRVAELPAHPFFLGTLFQPELAERADPHPIIQAWATAAMARTGLRAGR